MKEVKKDRDGIRKELKKRKRREAASTNEHPLAPLRGESAAEGRIDYVLVPLSGGILGLGDEVGPEVVWVEGSGMMNWIMSSVEVGSREAAGSRKNYGLAAAE
ncbi:hypothetical protein LR48_Vigan10g142300 [Vigna angularis]|uniref:Uncharacterized protein n=1 Tax=Phaseolus angularis TaxID=3914 RepID=A0A0L9VKG1_PHAAN|nr:hypothetical protein LR48_Vigan10g142300 [Vigna angularis]